MKYELGVFGSMQSTSRPLLDNFYTGLELRAALAPKVQYADNLLITKLSHIANLGRLGPTLEECLSTHCSTLSMLLL